MEPLAAKIRPKSLEEFIGQEHLVGKNGPIREAIVKKHLFSFILWGPPGVGKTTIARIYAHALDAEYFELSAVSASKDDIRKILNQKSFNSPKLLFLDEIHRFNKAQQDFLLPFVESGELILIGATTENPSFEVISALLSRLQVFLLKEFSDAEMKQIIERAGLDLPEDAIKWLINVSNGDARQVIGLLENASILYNEISLDILKNTLQRKHLRYDQKGEEHYNNISAYIKSMRASQPDAALYYLARMIEGGEDPLFIARRMVVFASEDVGLAHSQALVMANNVFRACEIVGYPECAINLAHGTCYLALAKKNRDSYNAYFEALADVKKMGNLPIPLMIRNAPTKLMKDAGYGQGYDLYPKESLLPEKIKNKVYLKKTEP